jgi:hypothetical protein
MSIAAEFTAALPEPQIILGLRLLPLSLGRYQMLKRFDCPFVDDEMREVQTDSLTKELFFALLICGLPVSEFKQLLNQPKKLAKEARRFGKVSGKVIARTKGFNIFQSFEQFKRYLSSATSMPWHVSPRSRDDGESVSHWSHSMEVTLRARAGWSQNEIDEEPMSKAMTFFFKYLESEGQVDLVTHETWEYIESTGEANAKALAEHIAVMQKASN